MKHPLRAAALFLLAALVLPAFAAEVKDEKKDAPKADAAKKDDKADAKDAKPEAAKKDAKDPKADAAKKDDKADAAKKDDKKADPKKDDAKKAAAKKAAKKDDRLNTEKSVQAGQITGRVVAVEVSSKSIRLSVAISVPRTDLGAANNTAIYQTQAAQYVLQAQDYANRAQQAAAKAQQAAANKDKNGFSQNMSQAANYQAQANQAMLLAAQQKALAARQASVAVVNETRYQEIDLPTRDDVKVRQAYPPEAFDEKGKRRRLTAKELKEAKGDDPKLPGYQADFSSLREDQVITATLARPKDEAKPKPAAKKDKEAAKKDKEKDADWLGDKLPPASLIMIVVDQPQGK
jgi:hypothetical protein